MTNLSWTALLSVVVSIVGLAESYTNYRTYTMNQQQQRMIVQAHNALRRAEPAANMQEMVWDDNLAQLALGHTQICDAWHRPAHQRVGYGYSYIGENIWWSTETWLRSNLDRIIKDFYDEKPYFHFNTLWCQPGQQCGHYTQVVWSDSCAVGCAAAYCDGIQNGRGINHGHVYVCNYGPGGNKPGVQPYIYGPACSACPNGGKCYNGLCQTQCSGTSYFELAKPIPKIAKSKPIAPPPPPPPPPAPKPLPSGVCVDADSQCPFWSTIGECQRNPAYMNVNCRSSCSQCAFAGGDKQPEIVNVGCKDFHYLCPFWAGTGECELNPSWMLRNCVGSCNKETCNKDRTFAVPGAGLTGCADDIDDCEYWSSIGECQVNPSYMQWKCRKSCGLC